MSDEAPLESEAAPEKSGKSKRERREDGRLRQLMRIYREEDRRATARLAPHRERRKRDRQ